MISAEDINNWPQEWITQYENDQVKLTPREFDILSGEELKSNEGMVFGRMYAAWKEWKEKCTET